MSNTAASSQFRTLQGAKIEVERRGHGSPLLVLLSEEATHELTSPFLASLAERHELIIPQAPGFGRSERPDWIANPDDISYIYLDLLEAEGLRGIPVVGLSLGGWIALEMAIKDAGAFSRIALVNPLGVKMGGTLDRDFQDIWTLHPAKVAELKWHDQAHARRDFASMSEEEVSIYARNIESFARFCWEPYLHNPKLKIRLNRVKSPTLVLWGANDGVAKAELGAALASHIAGAKFDTIAAAGHYPAIEQPAETLKKIEAFLA